MYNNGKSTRKYHIRMNIPSNVNCVCTFGSQNNYLYGYDPWSGILAYTVLVV